MGLKKAWRGWNGRIMINRKIELKKKEMKKKNNNNKKNIQKEEKRFICNVSVKILCCI